MGENAFKINCLSCGREVIWIQHPRLERTLKASSHELYAEYGTDDGKAVIRINCACGNEVKEEQV